MTLQQKFYNNIITEINNINPDYLSNFSKSIRSHDQYKIMDELKGMEGIIYQAVAKHYNLNIDKVKNAKRTSSKINYREATGFETIRIQTKN